MFPALSGWLTGAARARYFSLYRVMDPPGLEPGSGERMRDLALPLNYRSMCPVSGAVTIYVKWVYLRGMASPDWSGPDSDRY